MHRWQLQRFVRVIVPVVLFISVLCAVVVRQRSGVGGRYFVADESYASLAVARNMVERGVYGFAPGARIAATKDTLWRLLLACVAWVMREPLAAAYVLGAACGVMTLLVILRLARLLFPFPPYVVFASVLLALAPGFVLETLSGRAAPLATCMITAACMLNMEGLAGRRSVLPAYSALLVGAAGWIRIEFILYWFVFSLHAWILSFGRRPAGATFSASYVVLRSIIGWLIIALCLLPLMTWNAVLLRVPWPRMLDTPLALDAWSGGSAQAFNGSLALTRDAVPRMYAALHQIPFLGWGLGRVLFWLGVVVLVGLAVRRGEERAFTLTAAIPLVLPPLYAVIYPYVGDGAAPMVYGAYAPLAAMMAAFGVFRLPFLIEAAYRKWKEGLPSAFGFQAWWIVVGSLVLLLGLVRSCRQSDRETEALARVVATRAAVRQSIEQNGLDEALFASDRPGWLSFVQRVEVLDLSGEGSADVLMCLDASGRLDRERLRKLLRERRPGALLIWNDQNLFVESLVSGHLLYSPGGEAPAHMPRLTAVTWAFGF
ncbi:MAG: hypothetical protein JXB04_02785 [Kiritimatiellae bacterium]|nr:hypothetical protein [Kiritimatiellia bacterium]